MNDMSTDNPPSPPGPSDPGFQTGFDDEYMDAAPKRSKALVVIAIVLLIGVIIALGFYAQSVQMKLEKEQAVTLKTNQELLACKGDIKNLNAVQEEDKKKCKEAGQAAEEKIAGLESAMQSSKNSMGELRDEHKQARQDLKQFKAFSAQFKRMTDAGKLEVVFRRGRMVVNLPAKVFFDSGSADLSKEGGQALEEVAKILGTLKDKRFVVAGHTDDEKIKKSKFESNWDLSTARALVVTKSLIKFGLKSWSLAAAGYSQYAPIASNKTEEGRQKNRRIEIILEPYLKDIEPPQKKSKSTKKKAATKARKK